jgi:predicted enzyme related to lactoylglutathione lyase
VWEIAPVQFRSGTGGQKVAKVVGVGGVFFKVESPKVTQEWYARVLGLELVSWGGAVFGPLAKGKTAWTPFSKTTRHFEPSTRDWMVNYVVDDLAGVLARCKAEGVAVLKQEDSEGIGKFAWIMDPDGIKVELWEPAGEAHT